MLFARYVLILVFFTKEDTVTNLAVVIDGVGVPCLATASEVFSVLAGPGEGYLAKFTKQ